MSTTLPNSPMMLDSTGQSIVQKLQGIINALGGGGGGDMVMPPEYDPDQETPYYQGQYITYQDSLYKANTNISASTGYPVGAFDSTKWDEITDLFDEFFQLKPGVVESVSTKNEKFNDVYTNRFGSNVSYAHVEGKNNQAHGSYSHVEGYYSKAYGEGGHAEGFSVQAGRENAFMEYPHAEGYSTKAWASYAHAEGYNATAVGLASHAEGNNTQAIGSYSHASGNNTIANNSAEAAFGVYNSSGNDTLFSVGNGSSNNSRSNAFEVLRDGTCKAGNKVIIALDPPTTDGTYALQCTVTNGVATYSWV